MGRREVFNHRTGRMETWDMERQHGEDLAIFEDSRRRWRTEPDQVRKQAPFLAIAFALLDTYADEIDRLRASRMVFNCAYNNAQYAEPCDRCSELPGEAA